MKADEKTTQFVPQKTTTEREDVYQAKKKHTMSSIRLCDHGVFYIYQCSDSILYNKCRISDISYTHKIGVKYSASQTAGCTYHN